MQEDWQGLLRSVITDPIELLQRLALDLDLLPAARRVAKLFPLRVPLGFVSRMQKGNPHDPLLRQVLPLVSEEITHSDFSRDPLDERSAASIPGLLHKYSGRVLLTLTGACAINCRYCFRRHFPYGENKPGGKAWQNTLAYIAKDLSIYEVILSGGDPLIAPDDYLARCVSDLAGISHLRILRIHSRLPIVLPERINTDFLTWFTSTCLQPILVVHCNHANELDHSVKRAVDRLREKKITVLNQSVLLKGVNDSVNALVDLSQCLFEGGILPYYLHLLDKVQGATHFAVEEILAKQFMSALRERLPGYLVPRLVKEQAGARSKLAIF